MKLLPTTATSRLPAFSRRSQVRSSELVSHPGKTLRRTLLLWLPGRRLRRVMLGVALALVAGFSYGVHRLGDTLLVPARRLPGDWQNAVLQAPAKHGVSFESFAATGEDGMAIPALLVRPAGVVGSGIRYREMQRRLGTDALFRFEENPEAGESCAVAVPVAVRGTVVMLHGRSGIKEDGVTIAERFAAAGLATVLFDSRGHGESHARYMSYGQKEVDDLRCVIAAVRARFDRVGDAGTAPVMLFGNSMGAAVTLQALGRKGTYGGDYGDPGVRVEAERGGPIRAAVVVSPFADLSQLTGEMLQRRLPGGAGVGIVQGAVSMYAQARAGFSLDAIRPVHAASAIECPVMVVHGDGDGVIPVEHGRRIFAALPEGEKLWREVPGAQHSNVLMHGGDDLYEEMIRFVLAHSEPTAERRTAMEMTAR